jgi:sulfite exporter TauE/SafE
MDWSVVGTALALGFAASISCLGICIPILIPYIMGKDKTLKEGFITSSLFSLGRVIIYYAIGIVVFLIGMALTEDAPESWLTFAVAILGMVVIIYGVWIVFKLPTPKWCPAKLAEKSGPVFSVVLGLLIGSFFCPALWIALVGATLTRDFTVLLLSVGAFWAGSSIFIMLAGSISGEVGGRWGKKIGVEKLKDVCGMVLILAGAFYLISGLTG